MKVILNRCFGGFDLSERARGFLEARRSESWDYWVSHRDDPALVKCVEALGDKADSDYSQLEVFDIPDGIRYEIIDYDGIEWAVEVGHIWP